MQSLLRRTFVAAALLALSIGVAAAGAASSSSSSKLTYDETVTDTGGLLVSFSESGQKRFASVDYRLDATESAFWICDNGSTVGEQSFPSNTVTGLVPDDKGHVAGSISLPGPEASSSSCAGMTLQEVDYTNVTLTDLTSGHVYRLDSLSRNFA